MNEVKILDQRYETVAWGALLIFVGLISLIPGVLPGTGSLGVGIILLGLNLARYLSKIPMNGFTVTLGGVLFALGGGVYLLRALLRIPIELPFFETMLIVIGVVFIIRGITKTVKREVQQIS